MVLAEAEVWFEGWQSYSAGNTASTPFFFSMTTRNLAGSVALALRPTVCTSSDLRRKFVPESEDLLAASNLFDDRPFEHVDEGIRVVTMDMLHSSGRIFDGEHHHLLSGRVNEILLHDGDYDWLRRFGERSGCELRTGYENKRRSKKRKGDMVVSIRE